MRSDPATILCALIDGSVSRYVDLTRSLTLICFQILQTQSGAGVQHQCAAGRQDQLSPLQLPRDRCGRDWAGGGRGRDSAQLQDRVLAAPSADRALGPDQQHSADPLQVSGSVF